MSTRVLTKTIVLMDSIGEFHRFSPGTDERAIPRELIPEGGLNPRAFAMPVEVGPDGFDRDPDAVIPENLEDLTIAQLRTVAEANEIDFDMMKIRKRGDMIEVLRNVGIGVIEDAPGGDELDRVTVGPPNPFAQTVQQA